MTKRVPRPEKHDAAARPILLSIDFSIGQGKDNAPTLRYEGEAGPNLGAARHFGGGGWLIGEAGLEATMAAVVEAQLDFLKRYERPFKVKATLADASGIAQPVELQLSPRARALLHVDRPRPKKSTAARSKPPDTGLPSLPGSEPLPRVRYPATEADYQECLDHARAIIGEEGLRDTLILPTTPLMVTCRAKPDYTGKGQGCGADVGEPCKGASPCESRLRTSTWWRTCWPGHDWMWACPTCRVAQGTSCIPTLWPETIPPYANSHPSRRRVADAFAAACGIPPVGTKAYQRCLDHHRYPQDPPWTRETATAVYIQTYRANDAVAMEWATPILATLPTTSDAPAAAAQTPEIDPQAGAVAPAAQTHPGPKGGTHPGPLASCRRAQCVRAQRKVAESETELIRLLSPTGTESGPKT